MKISEAILKLTNIKNEEGDIDLCTFHEIDEFFAIGNSYIDVIDYPTDEQEQNWERVAIIAHDSIDNTNPGLRVVK